MAYARAPYLEWAKLRPHPRWDLAGSNLQPCTLDDLPGAAGALELAGDNDDGYRPLVEAIAGRYGVHTDAVATATGTSGANFLVFAALLSPGDEVLVERPGYDPLLAAPMVVGARVSRFDRRFEDGYQLDPDRVERALTPRTRLIVVTNLHNPSGVAASPEALEALGRLAERAGVRVLVDEVYLDTTRAAHTRPAVHAGDRFITTSSLTKSYGLSGLRCGWVLGQPDVVARVRRTRDLVDGTGAFPAERLSVLAFSLLDRLADRARRILEPNLRAVSDFLDARRIDYVRPAGGTVVFPRLTGVDASAFAESLIARYETAVVPGRFFEAPSHVRLSFGGRQETVVHGLDAIGRALDEARDA